MPGSPIKRERVARESSRYDEGQRLAILAEVDQKGEKVEIVAKRHEISPATIRTWRRRAKLTPHPQIDRPRAASSTLAPTGATLSRAQQLWAEADSLGKTAHRRFAESESLFEAGASGRDAATSGGILLDKGEKLERRAQTQEQHEATLSNTRAREVIELVRQAITEDLDLPLPPTIQPRLEGKQPTPEQKQEARQAVRAKISAEVRREALAEIERERASIVPSVPVKAESEQAEAEDTPAPDFADMPEDWAERFRRNPERAAQEYANAQVRAENARRRPAPRAPKHHPTFTHPGLAA